MAQITQREALDIADRMLEHQTVIEKLGFYVNQCDDPQLKQIIQRHQGTMQQHYNTLSGFLQAGGPAPGRQPMM